MRWICTPVIAMVIAIAMNPISISKAQTESSTDRTLRHAITAYTEEDYTSAYAQMLEYLPMASADAAYYLGLMNINAEGTDYNPVGSLAYFQAANEWGHPEAEAVAAQIEPHLTAEQLADAAKEFAALQQQVEVPLSRKRFEHVDIEYPERTRSRNPRYPRDRQMERAETWITLMQVISTEGKVITSTPVRELPEDFMRSTRGAENLWRYEAPAKIYPRPVRISFDVQKSDSAEYEMINKVYEPAYELAMGGVPEQQMFLAQLAMARSSSVEHEGLDEVLRNARNWHERAARGGYLPAQRYLAIHAYSEVWGDYLIAQGDSTTMTYYGLNLYALASDPEQSAYGEQLIREAAATGNEDAAAIVPHL